MPPINPQLMARLEAKLEIGRRRLNERITAKANSERIERVTAALILAADEGISITRYSTPEERAAMKGGGHTPAPTYAATTRETPRIRAKRVSAPRVAKAKEIDENTVFVVHGRDEKLTKSIFEFLRSISLKPIEWEKAVLMPKDNSPHLQQILDAAMGRAQAVLVVFSPDDDAYLTPSLRRAREPRNETKLQGQPRQNVLFEAGLAIGNHAQKTVCVQVGKLREISDIVGRHITRLTDTTAKRIDLINRLEKAGCKPDRQGSLWTEAGKFVASRDQTTRRP